jgi:hypothetical protein
MRKKIQHKTPPSGIYDFPFTHRPNEREEEIWPKEIFQQNQEMNYPMRYRPIDPKFFPTPNLQPPGFEQRPQPRITQMLYQLAGLPSKGLMDEPILPPLYEEPDAFEDRPFRIKPYLPIPPKKRMEIEFGEEGMKIWREKMKELDELIKQGGI